VIVCLHGKSETHRMAFDHIRIPDFVGAAGQPLAVAAVDGGADSYWHPRRDGTDALAMLLEEFVPLVERRVGRVPRALMGWSMGGYGALLAAEQAPAMFGAVAVGSAALWRSPGATAPGAFDDADDYHRHDVYASIGRLRSLAVRVDCGTSDPFYAADRAFVSGLPAGAQSSFGPGFHDDAYWRSRAPAQIGFVAAALGVRPT
jgi:enterochelin esterase-like enzyme